MFNSQEGLTNSAQVLQLVIWNRKWKLWCTYLDLSRSWMYVNVEQTGESMVSNKIHMKYKTTVNAQDGLTYESMKTDGVTNCFQYFNCRHLLDAYLWRFSARRQRWRGHYLFKISSRLRTIPVSDIGRYYLLSAVSVSTDTFCSTRPLYHKCNVSLSIQ